MRHRPRCHPPQVFAAAEPFLSVPSFFLLVFGAGTSFNRRANGKFAAAASSITLSFYHSSMQFDQTSDQCQTKAEPPVRDPVNGPLE